MSLLEFYYCSCDGPHRCHSYNQSLCCLLPFYQSHMYSCTSLVLVKLYPYKASVL